MDKPPSSPRRGNPGRDAPGGWSTSRHYYIPRQIKLVPGVSHKRGPREDLYGGKAEDLVASQILTADMFPPDGLNSISWRPETAGIPRHMRDGAGNMVVRRRTRPGMFTVEVWCGREEKERREAAEQQGREHRVETQDLAPDERAVIEVYTRMPAPIKPVARLAMQELVKAQSEAEKTCLLTVWQACCAAANQGMPAASPSRGHLRLVWSAPQAPAWTSDL